MDRRRRRLDERGRPIVEVRSETGSFRADIDTARVRELRGDQLSLQDTLRLRRPHFEPYGSGAPTAAPRRNGLDYLRALSEEIKKRRRTPQSGE